MVKISLMKSYDLSLLIHGVVVALYCVQCTAKTPCIRIGVMKNNFVFDQILHFYDYTRVQLG